MNLDYNTTWDNKIVTFFYLRLNFWPSLSRHFELIFAPKFALIQPGRRRRRRFPENYDSLFSFPFPERPIPK